VDLTDARVLYRACPLCDASDLTEEHIGDCRHHPRYHPEIPSRMRWVRCAACGHVFTEGYLSPRAADLVFAGANPHQRPGWDLYGSRTVSARIVEKVRAVLGGVRGCWLDVGFGNGALLGAAQEYGFDTVGLDLRVENVELKRTYGFEAHAVEVTSYEPDAPLAAISLADVLEHVPFPKFVLAHAHRILSDDGVLFLSMPNSDCFVWKRLDDLGENPYWGELEHYHNFGRRRLYALLEEHGFSPVSYGISERYYMCMEVLATKR
jgi:SAM-dependent methyltransferase